MVKIKFKIYSDVNTSKLLIFIIVGVTGVKENACLLKELSDARQIRLRIIECFEIAANPNTSLQERERFIINN